MARKKNTSWQFKVSSALTILLLILILGYFVESFIAIRKVKPVTVAIERLADQPTSPVSEQSSPSE
jgi:hypothetical protein